MDKKWTLTQTKDKNMDKASQKLDLKWTKKDRKATKVYEKWTKSRHLRDKNKK